MRAYEFLIEYDRSKTVQSLGNQIRSVIDNDNTFREKGETVEQQIEQLFDKFEAVDPSPNKQYVRWIATQYTKGMVKYEDLYKITNDLTEFTQYKPQLKRLGHSADINQYTPRTLTQLIAQLSNTELNSEPDNAGDDATTDPEVKILYNGPLGTLSTPLTQEASCKLGKGTRWCTAATESDNLYSYYTKSGPLYIWRDRSGEKYQFHLNTDDFEFSAMDAQNEELEPEELGTLKSNPVLKKLFALFDQRYLDAIKSGASITDINYIYTLHPTGWPEIEPYLMKNPFIAIQYARDVIGGRWPDAEPVLMKDPISAANYARFILKKPWPAAEPHIMKDASLAVEYARDVLKKRWPAAEPHIMKDARLAVEYARDVLKKRWPEAEDVIKTDPYAAARYAINVLRNRWPEAEELIKSEEDTWEDYKAELLDEDEYDDEDE